MLTVHLDDDEVFAHYLPPDAGPNNGGYLGRVFPDGHFKGLAFEQLRALNSGQHDVAVDEHTRSDPGREPEGRTEYDRRLKAFQFALFMYTVGASTAAEVLHRAREAVHYEIEQGMTIRHHPG
jgi:hypothetical protein